jgi:membrane protein
LILARSWRSGRNARPLRLLLDSVRGFLDDNAASLAAALAYYTLLSFAPLLALTLWATASMGNGTQDLIVRQLALLLGNEAAAVARSVIENAENRPSMGTLTGVIGILVSLFAATSVFAQLQHSLNLIWNIESRPGNAIRFWLRRRLLSIGLRAAIMFVALVSMLASALIGVFLGKSGPVWDVINHLVTAFIFVGLFTLLFRDLPDARLPWPDALHGGLVTAILFTIGKTLLGLYLSSGQVGGAYGAAGSVVLLMIWAFYASAIFFLGAEYVQARLRQSGRSIAPSPAGQRAVAA